MRHRHETPRCYIDAMIVPAALIAIMAVSLSVIVVLVTREVSKR